MCQPHEVRSQRIHQSFVDQTTGYRKPKKNIHRLIQMITNQKLIDAVYVFDKRLEELFDRIS